MPTQSAPKHPPIGSTPPSKWFYAYEEIAEQTADDATALGALIDSAEKTIAAHDRDLDIDRVRAHLDKIIKFLRKVADGDGADAHWDAVVTCTAVLHYLVSPGDLVPDWIEGAGMADDAAVVEMAWQSVGQHIKA